MNFTQTSPQWSPWRQRKVANVETWLLVEVWLYQLKYQATLTKGTSSSSSSLAAWLEAECACFTWIMKPILKYIIVLCSKYHWLPYYYMHRKLTGDGLSFLTSWSDFMTGDRLWSCFTSELTCTLCDVRFILAFSFTCLGGLYKDLNVMTQ